MTEYKKQHTITKAYLREFADPETPESLWRYKKSDSSCERKNVASATVRHFAFSYKNENGDYDHEIEKLWQFIEDTAIPILKSLLAGRALDLRQKTDLGLLFATFVKRQALMLDTFNQAMSIYGANRELQAKHLDEVLEEFDHSYSKDQIEEIKVKIRNGELPINLEAARRANMVGSLDRFRVTASIIARMDWQIWIAKDEFFVTSDSPVFVRRNGHYDDPGIVGLNRADLKAELYVPLSSKKFLIAKHESCKPKMKATKSRVRELNALVIRMAYQHVYSKCENDTVARLLTANAQYSPPTLNLDKFFANWNSELESAEGGVGGGTANGR